MPDSGSSRPSAELVDRSSISDSGEWRGSDDEQSDSHVRLEQRDTAGEVWVQTSWGQGPSWQSSSSSDSSGNCKYRDHFYSLKVGED